MRTGKYTRQQIELLRDELNDVYKRAEEDIGNISWKEIAEWIEEAFENLSIQKRKAIAEPFREIKTINLSKTDSFRKFCVGETKRMESIKLIAIDIWLTEKDQSWSQLTTDQSSRFQNYSQAGVGLANYLFKNSSEAPALDIEVLAGDYTGVYCLESEEDGGESDFTLSFQKSLAPRILVVELEEYKTFTGSVRLQNGRVRKGGENNLYSGWVTLSPEDNLICYLKNVESGANSIYYLIAVNDSVFDGEKADCLLFLDRQIPSEICEAEKRSEFTSYLMEWAKENQGNLIKFKRSSEDV